MGEDKIEMFMHELAFLVILMVHGINGKWTSECVVVDGVGKRMECGNPHNLR
jgi:hypothetical protein